MLFIMGNTTQIFHTTKDGCANAKNPIYLMHNEKPEQTWGYRVGTVVVRVVIRIFKPYTKSSL